jgi:divinyl chlorophyllide a 8-vinyl-reductase
VPDNSSLNLARRILLVGATGTIGRATLAALSRSGYAVVCFVRDAKTVVNGLSADERGRIQMRVGDLHSTRSIDADCFRDDRFDAVISCLASRTGAPRDAWAVDHQAHMNLLEAARAAQVGHFVLLSAMCVQKPLLEFQKAKAAFEQALIGSGMRFSIVRPTAFFKSLSGQVERVRHGKSFLMFGNGELTACKPISDRDLAEFIIGCLADSNRWNRILPIGGPGRAVTPRQQGERLFALLGREPLFRHIPIALLDTIIGVLSVIGRLLPAAADKAEFARIGRYYATESMLVLDPASGRYDESATPSTGSDTLFDFYSQLIKGEAAVERGEHSVF